MRRLLAVLILALGALGMPLALPSHAAGSTGTTGIAAGDFNGDGRLDLAVGSPGEDSNAGQVNIIYGSNTGLTGNGDEIFTQNTPGVQNPAEANDNFGQSVATGDFNADGRDDLAIGAPGEGVGTDPGNNSRTGAVHILFGRAGGLSTNGAQYWHQDSQDIQGTAENGDEFGFSLAAGNFGVSPKDDLAIGSPFEDPGNPEVGNAGIVHVLHGSNQGLSGQGDQIWSQDTPGVKGVAVEGQFENFGFSLAAANFGKNANDDLAIGVPHDSSGGTNTLLDCGAVNVLYGSPNGLTANGDQRWTQDSDDIKDQSQNEDGFGWALSAGNVGKSRFADLAVGSIFEDVGPEGSEVSNAGSVNVIYGGERGLRAKGNQFWTKMTPGIPGSLEDSNFGNTLAIGNLGKSGVADLAIGSPLQDVPGANSFEGEVTVIYGRGRGLRAPGSQSWTQDSPGINSNAENFDLFGTTAAIGNFGKSKRKDLAIGVPGEDSFAGAANVLYGRRTGLTAEGDQFWQQGLDGINGVAEAQDEFGDGPRD
jgi:hypothetical protein